MNLQNMVKVKKPGMKCITNDHLYKVLSNQCYSAVWNGADCKVAGVLSWVMETVHLEWGSGETEV